MYQAITMRALLLFNRCASYFSSVKQSVYHTYDHIKQLLCNYNYSTWIFLPGYYIPLPFSFISNHPIYYWKYHSQQNHLIYHTTKPLLEYTLSILSAKLIFTQSDAPQQIQEYDMDPFLETFRVCSDAEHLPTLKMIVMSWCAHHKLWFSGSIHMEYIDHQGNMVNINLADKHMITLQQNKLYIASSLHSTYHESYPTIRPQLH